MAKKEKQADHKGVTAKQKENHTLRFDYIKSNCFRVIRVDGVHGSPTPKGDIQVAFFSERFAIPKSEKYIVKKGVLGKRIGMTTRGTIVREVEVEAILSVEMAKIIEKWLHEKIQHIENLRMKGNSNG